MHKPKCHRDESQEAKVQTHCGEFPGYYESQKLKRPKKYTAKIKTDASEWHEKNQNKHYTLLLEISKISPKLMLACDDQGLGARPPDP